MKVSERMVLKDRLKKLGIFCLIVFIPVLVLSVVMMSFGVSEAVNIIVTVVVLFVLFFPYLYVCSLIDKKKEKRLKESGKKDPFSEE